MNRIDIINRLVRKFGYESYLEIGTQSGICYNQITAPLKQGVDPAPAWLPDPLNLNERMFVGTSDAFFEKNKRMFDIVLIDGDHTADQCERDIRNAMQCLNLGGTIVCHDMLPKTEEHQMVPRQSLQWTGDVWKAWVKLRSEREDWRMCVINTDWGVGLIQRGRQNTITMPEKLTWPAFKANHRKWLNLQNSIPAEFLL